MCLNPYGVDTSIFTPRTTMPAKPRFVCVGTICLRKGHQYLFRAFEKVRKVLPDAELVCVGGYYPDFKKEKLRWQGTFTHRQNISNAELAKTLRESTAFVFPSNEEGFAKAIIEGMGARPAHHRHARKWRDYIGRRRRGRHHRQNAQRGSNRRSDDSVRPQIAKRMKKWAMLLMCAVLKIIPRGDFADRLVKMCGDAIEMKRANGKISFK